MIIEEHNSKKDQEAKRLRIKELWKVDLHEDYEIDWKKYPVELKKKGRWKGYTAATITIRDVLEKVMTLTFENGCEEDLEVLRTCLHQTNNEFKVEVDGFYY